MLNFLDGYKTFLAGLAAVVSGIGLAIPSWTNGTFFGPETIEAYQMIIGGFAVWGLGHKIEKN